MTTNLNENLTVISQQPFAFTLINLLKDKGVITTGITIPFIIGAYKIAKHDSIEVNLKFIYGQTNEKYKEDSRKSSTAYRKPITYSRASNFGSKNEM